MSISALRSDLSQIDGVCHLVLDIANDFADPRGSLYVKGGELIIPNVNRITQRVRSLGGQFVFCRCWHHPESAHFIAQGGPWPPHCVQNSWGAEFHPDLDHHRGTILSKGTRQDEDVLDPFDERAYMEGFGGTLHNFLTRDGVKALIVDGIATDYCDLAAVLSARKLDYRVYVVTDAIAAVNLKQGDGQRALDQMVASGAELVTTDDVLAALREQ